MCGRSRGLALGPSSRVETHRKASSPRKELYCCSAAQSLLVTRHTAPGHTEPLALSRSPFKVEQMGPDSCRGRAVPQCTGARLLPGTWAPSSLGRRGALGFLGVGDFAQKDDALSVFVQYGNQKRPVETDN